MINPKDPFHPILSKDYSNEYYLSGGMTIELEIASRILANTWALFVKTASDAKESPKSNDIENLCKNALSLSRKLIEEANK